MIAFMIFVLFLLVCGTIAVAFLATFLAGLIWLWRLLSDKPAPRK